MPDARVTIQINAAIPCGKAAEIHQQMIRAEIRRRTCLNGDCVESVKGICRARGTCWRRVVPYA